MADYAYNSINVASGDAAQATITRAENIVTCQVNFTGVDGDLEVVWQQSHDDTNWLAMRDRDGEYKVAIPKLTKAPTHAGSVMKQFRDIGAKYVRPVLKVKNSEVGTVSIIGEA